MRYWKSRKARGNPKVALAVAAYLLGDDARRRRDQLCGLIYSLRAQTHENWEAVVVHDGPIGGFWDCVRRVDDPRVSFVQTPEREGKYGHRWRREYLLKHTRGSYVGFCNDDAWFAPTYFEALLQPLVESGKRFAHCNMVLSHQLWKPVPVKIARGSVDVGGWLADRALVEATPWGDLSFAGDWTFVRALTEACGKPAIASVPHYLYVHN